MTDARKQVRTKGRREATKSPRTGRKATEAKDRGPVAQPAEERLLRAQAIAHVGDWEWDVATNAVHWSDELYRIYGFEPGSIAPDYGLILARMHPESKGAFLKAIDGALREDRHFELDYRFFRKDGSEAVLHTIGQVVRDGSGAPARMLGIVQDITERTEVEAALRESAARLRTLIDAIPDMVFFKDLAGRHVIDNKASEAIVGMPPEMLAGKTAEDLMSPESAAVCRRNDEEVMRSGETVRCEEHTKDKKGAKRVLDTIRVPLYDDNGNSMGLVGIIRDITERKRSEERLRESEDRFRSIFEHATDGIMIADPKQKRNIEANQTMCDMLGRTREEILSLRLEDMHPETDVPRILDLFDRQVRGEISLAPDIPMVRKDGSVIYVDVNSTPVTLGGEPCLLGVFRDITERKRAVEALKTRERQLAESQRIGHIGSWEHNLQSGQVFWSDELFRLLGLEPGKDPADFNMFLAMLHPDDQPLLRAAVGKTLREKKPFSIEYRFVRRDGSSRIIHAQAELLPDAAGEPVILSGTAQDITDRKRTEEKIRQSEQFIRSILDTVDEGFIVIDRDYHIITANKAYCGQTGLPCDEVIGKHCFEISHGSSRPCYEEGEECAVRQTFATGEVQTALHKHRDHDGHLLYVETKGFPIKDGSGGVTSVIETINNITEKHLLEEERLKMQKLESIGTLAGGIAHDFNNLLQGVFGYIAMAKLSIDRKGHALEMLEQAERAVHQSVSLTSQLLTFSKGGKPVKRQVSLAPIVENATKFALSGSRSDYRLSIPSDLWDVDADSGQVSQVIQNIVLNADQAMPSGGVVRITARNLRASDENFHPALAPRDCVVIEVRDTGVGIPAQNLEKIFDPYFTTKEKGSGLGLATSYSIIKNHDGRIDVSSTVGEGSTFAIYLPAAKKASVAKAMQPALSSGRHVRVLVMDDEEVVRKVAGELIRVLGHDAEFAANGEEAVTKFRAALDAGRPFDIVILDLTVRGGMGGAQTVKKLREIDPGVPAVMSSGYSDDSAVADFQDHGFQAFLQKPYDFKELNDVLNAVLS